MMSKTELDPIQPIFNPLVQLLGLGGAAYANDPRPDGLPNAEYDAFDFNMDPLNPNPFAKIIYLVALRDLVKDEEVLVFYGGDYKWKGERSKKSKFKEPERVFPRSFISSSFFVNGIRDKIKTVTPIPTVLELPSSTSSSQSTTTTTTTTPTE